MGREAAEPRPQVETPKPAGQRPGLAAQAGVPSFGACWSAPPCGKERQCRGQAPCPLDQPLCHSRPCCPQLGVRAPLGATRARPPPLAAWHSVSLWRRLGLPAWIQALGLRCCVTLAGSLTTLCLSFSTLQAGGRASVLFSACSLQTCRPEPYSHSCGRPVPERPAGAVSGAGGAGAPDAPCGAGGFPEGALSSRARNQGGPGSGDWEEGVEGPWTPCSGPWG